MDIAALERWYGDCRQAHHDSVQGMRFLVVLPLHEVQAGAGGGPAAGAAMDAVPHLAQVSVMVIDDDTHVREAFEAIPRSAGARTHGFSSGRLAFLQSHDARPGDCQRRGLSAAQCRLHGGHRAPGEHMSTF